MMATNKTYLAASFTVYNWLSLVFQLWTESPPFIYLVNFFIARQLCKGFFGWVLFQYAKAFAWIVCICRVYHLNHGARLILANPLMRSLFHIDAWLQRLCCGCTKVTGCAVTCTYSSQAVLQRGSLIHLQLHPLLKWTWAIFETLEKPLGFHRSRKEKYQKSLEKGPNNLRTERVKGDQAQHTLSWHPTSTFTSMIEFTLNHGILDIFGHCCVLNIHPLRSCQDWKMCWNYLESLSQAPYALMLLRSPPIDVTCLKWDNGSKFTK